MIREDDSVLVCLTGIVIQMESQQIAFTYTCMVSCTSLVLQETNELSNSEDKSAKSKRGVCVFFERINKSFSEL